MQEKTLLKNIDIHFISLVKSGANKKHIIYKSNSEENPTFTREIKIAKVDSEKRMVYGIVYSPNELDTDNEFSTIEEIEKASQNFMKNARTTQIDKQHNEDAKNGFVAENWITKENDSIFSTDPVGSWAVGIKIEDDNTWEEVKKGEIKGLSMGGFSEKETIDSTEKSEKNFINKFVEAIKKAFQQEPVQKDFNSNFNARQFEEMTWALSSAIREVMNDEKVDDKKSEIIKNIEQFKSAIEALKIEKAGKTISASNLSKIKTAIEALSSMLTQIEETTKSGEIDMTQEELNGVVSKAVADAVAPLNTKIEALEKSISEQAEAVKKSGEKIEVLEKSTAGSQQSDTSQSQEKSSWL